MKKLVVLGILLIFTSLSLSAQGFYFDIGLGFGKGGTKIGSKDVVDDLKRLGASVDEIGVDLGFKAGYGPIGNMPIYLVGELGGVGHRIYDSFNYLQYNTYLFGPGIIIYPVSFLQLGSSIGYSWVSNQTDLPMVMDNSDGGFAWNISAAIDLGKRAHGFLIGIKYFTASNSLKTLKVDQQSSLFNVFFKYAFRRKV